MVASAATTTARLRWLKRAAAQRLLHSASRSSVHARNKSRSSSSSTRQAPRLRNWLPDRSDVAFEFKCTQCGKCCTGKGGRVRVNEYEIEAIAAALPHASVTDVKRSFLRRVPVPATLASDANGAGSDELRPQEQQWVLRQTPDDSQCIFLDGAKCSIYQARPTQCRTFPWWPQHLVSDYDWRLAARECEGITLAPPSPPRSAAEQSAARTAASHRSSSRVAFDDVLPHAILHDIHRAGENYTHDELEAMLRDLASVEPHFVADYKREFVRSYARHVVYCDADVAVFDTLAPGEAPTRSFVFTDRLHLVQSEVALALPQSSRAASSALDASVHDAAAARVDRQTLTLDVHRAMCVALALLPPGASSASPPTAGTSSASARSLRVAVIGAGAGALPLFLLAHVPRIAALDAVEPSAAVNRVARQFFGLADAERSDARLRVHECLGEAFVAEQLAAVGSGGRYDLVLLDVEAGDSDDGDDDGGATERGASANTTARGDPSAAAVGRGIRAPPASMLARTFLADVKALLAPAGVLVVNVIAADDAALMRAEAALARGFSQDALLVQLATNAVVFLFGDAHASASAASPLESLAPLSPLSAGMTRSAESADVGAEDDAALRRRVLEMLEGDAFQTERVRSLALLQRHASCIRRLRVGVGGGAKPSRS